MQILRGIREQRGMTLVIVTHENEIAESAPRHIRIRDGRIESERARACIAEPRLRLRDEGARDPEARLGDPYFSHPLEVAAILTDLKVDDATIVAAMLHDTIEDTEITREDVDKAFGEEIGGLVDGLTKLGKLDFVTKHAQQAENFRKLLLAIADDARVLLVKLADRLHNMRTLQYVPEEKRARIAQDTLDIYAPLAGRMGMQSMRSDSRTCRSAA